MALTLNEAIEHAMKIWGASRVRGVRLNRFGGAGIELNRDDSGRIGGRFHFLDPSGHAACHDGCGVLEEAVR